MLRLNEKGQLRLTDIEAGDEFVAVIYFQYGYGIESAFTYKVIRAGKRDVVCNVEGENNLGDGKPMEFRFKREDYWTSFYRTDAPEVLEARAKIKLNNRRAYASKFLRETSNTRFDLEFLDALDAFKKRINK